jgi:hypothetical protein
MKKDAIFGNMDGSTHFIGINGPLHSEILPAKIKRFEDNFNDKIYVRFNKDCNFNPPVETEDSWKKFCYAVMVCVETECDECKSIQEVYQTDGFKLIQSLFGKEIVIEGNWRGRENKNAVSSLKDMLEFNGISITDFIFDENVELSIEKNN